LTSARPPATEDELAAPFEAAARDGRLLVQRCSACARSFYRPEPLCPFCLSLRWEWVESSGRGVVYSVTVVHRAPTPGFSTPFALAVVELEEAWTMLTNIVGCAPERVHIGMEVAAVFEPSPTGQMLIRFRPRTGET
jgi:uncharacterized OB-fold protein